MEPMKRKFGDAVFNPSSILSCNKENRDCATLEEMNRLKTTCDELGYENKRLKEQLSQKNDHLSKIGKQMEQQNTVLAKHTVLLEKILGKMFPEKQHINIFPIKNKKDFEEVDNNLISIPECELIRYIRETIGKTPVGNCIHLFFSEDFILQINWDGLQKKIAVKNSPLFSKIIFDAVKNESFGYGDYEKSMRTGFRLAKNRCYKNKFKSKQNLK